MELHVGERLPGSGPAQQPGGYVVSALVAETPWYGLYAGKKIFYNFDFTTKRLRETDETEWVDVFLRTIRYPYLDDPAYVAQRRTLARGEVRRILGSRASNLWPEAIDLLEVPNTRDPFVFAMDQEPEPIVVFARPHGLPLAGWQQSVLPLAAILGVLAELLEFLRQAHAEGLLLHGLGPGAVLVDRSDRIHYLGTDMVIEPASADLSGQAWARLYPPERFPRGFSAPEVFAAGTRPDQRADFYAWACVAYFLLTGKSPVQIALEQGKPWAHFQEPHFTRLEQSLREVPSSHVRNWAEQLGVSERSLSHPWPDNVLNLFRVLLHPNPERRPGTVQELLVWIDAPPPLPPAAALALVAGPGEARVLLDWSGAGHGLDMMVRRGVGRPPLTPTDGAFLEQGPARASVADPAIPLTHESIFYTVFALRHDPAGPTFSAGLSTELHESSPAAFLRLAEQEAGLNADSNQPPPRLALLFASQEKLDVVQALFRSNLPGVRRWALTELESVLGAESTGPWAHELMWKALRDPVPELVLQAARGVLAQPQTDERLLELAHFVGQGDVDDALRIVDVFVSAGLDRAQADRVRDKLEEERPTTCPECQVPLARRERSDHLRREHGYLDLGGSLLPRAVVLDRLWDRVLFQGELESHERILQIVSPSAEDPAPAYTGNFEEALARRRDLLGLAAEDQTSRSLSLFQPYLACLLRTARVEALVAEMLHSGKLLVRDLAREGWLRLLGDRAAATPWSRATLKQELDRLGAPLEEKLLLCRRLPEAGIEPGVARACLKLLEAERPIRCEECAAWVRQRDLETHLRRAHGIFQFRGERQSLAATRDAMLAVVCSRGSNEAVWQALEELAADQDEARTDALLVSWLGHGLHALGRKGGAGLAALADVLVQGPSGLRLLPWLVRPLDNAAHQVQARQLALEVGARLQPPVAGSVLELLAPLLSDREVPHEVRQTAVMGLMRTTGKQGPAAIELLQAYVAQSGKKRAIDRLRELEQRAGQSAALDELCARLEDQVRMTCPKCNIQMTRADMVPHLWERHRLVLDGRRVREPWRVLDDWVVEYGLEKDVQVLNRCRELAHKLDPHDGAVLLRRTMLRHGVEDRGALADLAARAREIQATLCPHCFGEVPLPALPPPLPLQLDRESLAGAGFHITVSERGFYRNLEIYTPDGMFYEGREPGSALTRNGALVGLVGPVVLAFVVVTELFTGSAVPLPVVLLLALGIALVLGGFVFLYWPAGPPGKERLLEIAWDELVPEIVKDPKPGGIVFLGGLALASLRKGDAEARAEVLDLACDKVAGRVAAEPAALVTLGVLVRLSVEDAQARDEDPLPLVAEQVNRCLRGELPLSHAALVLEDFFGPQALSWPRKTTARLHVLVCARAFEARLELTDLAELGRMYPSLAGALGLADLDRVAQLRHLWSLRATRSWERLGKATSVFDVVADAGRSDKYLARFPDLLLQVRDAEIALGSQGVWFKDICLFEMPDHLEVVDRRLLNDKGYDLVVGKQHFRYDEPPHEVAERLKTWLSFYFQEFVAQLAPWHNRTTTEACKRLRSINALVCPECRCALLGRLGEVGTRVN